MKIQNVACIYLIVLNVVAYLIDKYVNMIMMNDIINMFLKVGHLYICARCKNKEK